MQDGQTIVPPGQSLKDKDGQKHTRAVVGGDAAIVGDTMQAGQTIVPPRQSLKDKVGRRSGLASVLGDAAIARGTMPAGHKRVIAKSVKDSKRTNTRCDHSAP